MPRTNGWIHDFDPDDVPNGYAGISFSEIVAALNTHSDSNKHLSYDSNGLSIDTMRDHQYKHSLPLEQSSSAQNIKMSNFRNANLMALYIKVSAETYYSGEDTGRINVRIVGGSGGTYQAALFENRTDSRDKDAKITGNTVDLDPHATVIDWDDITDNSDKVTITSSTDEFLITSVGGNPSEFSPSNWPAGQYPWYKLLIHDQTSGNSLFHIQVNIMIPFIYNNKLYPRDWPSSGKHGAGYRYLVSPSAGGTDAEYDSGVVSFPNQSTAGDWSDEVLIVYPGRDGIM